MLTILILHFSKLLRPLCTPIVKFLSQRTQLKDQGRFIIEDEPYKDIHFRDMLLGVAIGDSFGAGVEMKTRSWICQNVKFDKYVNGRGDKSSYSINYAPGLYTDDTEMTLAVVKALLSNENMSEQLLIKYFRSEFNQATNWLGIPRQGHGSIKDYFLGMATLEAIQERQRKNSFPGNAPPMRAIPIGLIHDFNKMKYTAIVNATSTHPHPKAVTASFLTALASNFIIVQRKNPQNIISYCLEEINKLEDKYIDIDTVNKLKEVDKLADYHSFKLGDYGREGMDYNLLCGNETFGLQSDSMHTIICVLYLLKFHKTPLDTLQACIQVGGDVDSLASICLGIIGGRFGLRLGEDYFGGLPLWLVDPLEGVVYLQDMAKKFKHWYATQQN